MTTRQHGQSCGALPTTTTVLLRLPRSNWPIGKEERLAEKPREHLAFFGQAAKCEVAHTSLPIRPSKSPVTSIRREGRRGTKTASRQARICLRDGGDHPGDHDVVKPRVGCADPADGPDLPGSTFEFVLDRTSLWAYVAVTLLLRIFTLALTLFEKTHSCLRSPARRRTVLRRSSSERLIAYRC